MTLALALRCRCGASQGELALDPGTALHVVCYCNDCRAFAHAIGRADVLDANGGCEVVIAPLSRFRLGAGAEHIRCLPLSDKGMYRWYWDCCNTPFANTQPSTMAPAVSVHGASLVHTESATLASVSGPTIRIMARDATGAPPDAEAGIALPTLLKVVWFMLKNLVRGNGKPNPLYRNGEPIVVPRVLTPAERQALR